MPFHCLCLHAPILFSFHQNDFTILFSSICTRISLPNTIRQKVSSAEKHLQSIGLLNNDKLDCKILDNVLARLWTTEQTEDPGSLLEKTRTLRRHHLLSTSHHRFMIRKEITFRNAQRKGLFHYSPIPALSLKCKMANPWHSL